jgi:hypothetical protein
MLAAVPALSYVDARLTRNPGTPRAECRGVTVFHIADGRLNDVDLSGVDFAMYNLLPSKTLPCITFFRPT